MKLKDMIKARRHSLGMTLEDVARQVGVSKTTVQRWESGQIESLRSDKLDKLAEALRTVPASLMGWDGAPSVLGHKSVSLPREFTLPLLEEDGESGRIVFASSQGADFCLKMPDNSMLAAGLCKGDLVMIKEMALPEDGSLVAVELHGKITVRYFYQQEGAWLFQPGSPRHRGHLMNPADGNCHIRGKALSYQRNLVNSKNL